MAESFMYDIAETVLEKLASQVLQEVGLAWGFKGELERLEETLSNIQAVLLDAEEQQRKNHKLVAWLGLLKDIIYDADDLLDEFQCCALQREVVSRGSFDQKVRQFFSLSNPILFPILIGHKVKEIRERLDKMASEKAQFDLAERDVGSYVVHRDRERTHSFVHPSDVVGRDRDRELITDLLMHPGDGEGISVIPIVGIGGLGKTILAKFVYSDERLVCHFHMKLWVCVSENFDIKQLVGDLIESASGKKCDELSIDHLQTRLRNILNGKRFLLVLDDVWNEDRGRWIDLKSLLTSAANGSKILVTTRSHRVASIMGTVPEFKLGCLTHSACLSLFMRWAFQKGQEKDHPNLIEIGHEIVEKCKGVPLAVRTLGSLLYMNLDEREWLYVRDNEIWKLEQTETDILPALQLSYDQLPYYLKHCFAYCSIFPKDYVFRKDELIQLWIAQGLIIQLPHSNQELEDIGRRYFSLLWSRSFFQEAGEPGFSKTFKMHHLVHDLALSVAQTECMNICRETKNIPIKVRHISFHNHDLLEGQTPRFFLALKRLRSIKIVM